MYTITRDEYKVLLKNTDMSKLYLERDEGDGSVSLFSKETKELRIKERYVSDGVAVYEIHSEFPPEETKIPEGSILIEVNNWKEFQEVVDALGIGRKEKEGNEG